MSKRLTRLRPILKNEQAVSGRKEFSVSDPLSDRNGADTRTRNFRSIGFLLLGASGLCGLIAYERHRSATVTAQAFSDAVAGVEFEASVPMETWVAGFFCVLLGVAALRCLGQWYRLTKTNNVDRGVLP